MISSPKNATVAVSLAIVSVIVLLLATGPIAPQSTPVAQSPPAPQNPVPPTPQTPSNGGIRTTVELVVVPVTVNAVAPSEVPPNRPRGPVTEIAPTVSVPPVWV